MTENSKIIFNTSLTLTTKVEKFLSKIEFHAFRLQTLFIGHRISGGIT